MSETAKKTTDNQDVELEGLTKRSETTAYSPRPATTTTAGFSSFPGRTTTPTNSMDTPSTPAPNYGSSDSRRLVIGEGINISGEIEACNHLVVEGQVDASLKGANILDIAETGTFYGSVEINEGSIAGRFEGDLKVEGRLTVRSTGTIIGTLTYGELAVEAGASIEGKIQPKTATGSTRSKASSNANKTASTSSATIKKSSAPSMDNELPFATKAAS